MSLDQKSLIKVLENYSKGFSELDGEFLFLRMDGVLLWSNFSERKNIQELSALSAGLWQSACSLANYSDNRSLNKVLTFGTSSDGLLAQDIASGEKNYLLIMKFTDTLNPSRVKLKFRGLKQTIEENLYMESRKNKKPGFLNEGPTQPFKDITDEEMDNLFSFSEV